MVQRLRALTAPAEDPNLVLSTHSRQRPTAWNSRPGDSMASVTASAGTCVHVIPINSCRHTYTKINKTLEKKFPFTEQS